jgi:hypothetical protein
MEKQFVKVRFFLFVTIAFILSSLTVISFAQRTRDTDKPISGDFKITIKQTVSGQEMQTSTMIKGSRERSETVMNIPGVSGTKQVTITQCDLKRTVQINDAARKYLITPMDSGSESATATTPDSTAATSRGGVINSTINTIDTGERREMFGFTARHLKQTMISESSPDACNQQNSKFERDGWYINLEYGLNCGLDRMPQKTAANSGGCRDTYRTKRTGVANLGYALIETTTMYGADGQPTFTMTRQVVDLSRQSLDAALFDLPAGYTQASSQQDMYAAPSMGDTTATQPQSQASAPSSVSTGSMVARAKVGVVDFNNKAKASVSTDELRQRLITTLNGNGVEAIALNASSASEAEIEAKAKGCTYTLYTDISTLKAPSTGKKLGGMFGKATGIGSTDTGKSEAKLDYRLVPVGSSSPKLQSSASAKEATADASVNAALQDVARAVTGAVGN